MTNEKILESNKLIAEFVGWKQSDGQDGIYHKDQWYNDKYEFLSHGQVFKFHSSWDWLMPVVEKCKEIARDEKDYTVLKSKYSRLLHMLMTLSISDVYEAVYEFIKYYYGYIENPPTKL